MRTTLRVVIAVLDARAEAEWQKLEQLERNSTHPLATEGEQEGINQQRARWAAWDSAAEIAKGKGTTSFETEQRSV